MKSKKETRPSSQVTKIVLFGLDEDTKPRAARFLERDVEAAIKAASQLRLNVWKVTVDILPDLVMRAPIGNVAATGSNITSKVPREVYEAILQAATLDDPAKRETVPAFGDQDKAAAKALKQPELLEVERQIIAVAHERQIGRLPASWSAIKEGSVVLLQENRDDGWWEGLVLKRTGNMLTLRWRDYPKQPTLMRHVSTVALLDPTAN